MKDPFQVLHQKESEVTQLKMEIAALKVAIPLMVEEGDIKAAQEEKPKEVQP